MELTEVDEAHDRVCVIQEAAVPRSHGRLGLCGQRRLVVGISEQLRARGDAVVQVQHERGCSVVLGARVRPRPVRQPQDGEDLALHLSALLAAQPSLQEAGARADVHGGVQEGDPRGQHAVTPRQEQRERRHRVRQHPHLTFYAESSV